MRPVIFDIGLHNGDDSEFYLKKGFDVVGVEADPAHVERCRDRFAGPIAEGRMTVVHAAIADRDGEIDFYVNAEHDDWSSTLRRYAARRGLACTPVTVPAMTAGRLLEAHAGPREPYYVKIDIEGGDRAALASMLASRFRPRYLSVEAHELGYLALMHAMGYRRFKLVNQNLNWLVRLPDPPREGRHVEHAFGPHSSGPFGDETPGRWTGLERTAEAYLALKRIHRTQPALSNAWYDFHAALD